MDTRPVSFAGVGARRPGLLDLGALGTATTRESELVLGGTVVDRAGLPDAGDGRVGAAASRALIQIELIAGVVDTHSQHARTFRR